MGLLLVAAGCDGAGGQLVLGACDVWDMPSLERGVVDLAAGDHELDTLAELGIGLARPHRPTGHVFAMNLVRPPEAEDFDWAGTDHVVGRAGRAGVRLFVTLVPFADPAEATQAEPVHPVVRPEELEEWVGFVEAVVERYDGDGVDDMEGLDLAVYAWEVGNEPSCDPERPACASSYLELVRETWEAAHRADPEAVVLVGGAAPLFEPGGEPHPRVLATYEHFFANGGAEYTDAMGFHAYVGVTEPAVEDYVDAWRGLAGDLPLWLTETGPYAPGGEPAVAEDPADAAAWFVDHLDAAVDLGVERVFWCKAGGEWTEPAEVAEAVQEWVEER